MLFLPVKGFFSSKIKSGDTFGLRNKDAGGRIITAFHLPFPPRDTAVKAVVAEDVESRMPPPGEHFYHLLRYHSLIQQHPEYLVPEACPRPDREWPPAFSAPGMEE